MRKLSPKKILRLAGVFLVRIRHRELVLRTANDGVPVDDVGAALLLEPFHRLSARHGARAGRRGALRDPARARYGFVIRTS